MLLPSTQDIHVSKYEYDISGLLIEYTIKGDPREYIYLLPRELAEEKMKQCGNSPDDTLSQFDAILMVSGHIADKRKNMKAYELLDQATANVCTDLLNSFNVHRTH